MCPRSALVASVVICFAAGSLKSEAASSTQSIERQMKLDSVSITGHEIAPARRLFLERLQHLATVACSKLESAEQTAIAVLLAEKTAEYPSKAEVSPSVASVVEEDSAQCRFADVYCSEDRPAVLVRIDISPQTADAAAIAPLVAYEPADELPAGFQDSMALDFGLEGTVAADSTTTVRVTVRADKFWIIEEQAEFGGLPDSGIAGQNSKNTLEQLNNLVH